MAYITDDMEILKKIFPVHCVKQLGERQTYQVKMSNLKVKQGNALSKAGFRIISVSAGQYESTILMTKEGYA